MAVAGRQRRSGSSFGCVRAPPILESGMASSLPGFVLRVANELALSPPSGLSTADVKCIRGAESCALDRPTASSCFQQTRQGSFLFAVRIPTHAIASAGFVPGCSPCDFLGTVSPFGCVRVRRRPPETDSSRLSTLLQIMYQKPYLDWLRIGPKVNESHLG